MYVHGYFPARKLLIPLHLLQFGCAKDNFIENKVKPTSLGCFINIEKRIRYSNRSGLNWYEVLRQYDALYLCPSNWGHG